jgi:acetyl/propionyl-CoA carboxylase alpha subunit/acetyl-CoA carboxylase carboxyltransferase component
VRIARTCADLNIETVAVYAQDDSASKHLRVATVAAPLDQSGVAAYLNADALVSTALANGCDSVHPGWGFLSENSEFSRACELAGLTFIGPPPEQLQQFSDKLLSRALAAQCDVPVTSGGERLAGARALEAVQAKLKSDQSLMVKATAGGGGRGMALLGKTDDASAVFERCTREALSAFGDGTLYAEAFIEHARHIEVQMVGDGTGEVTHLGNRDCSVQRRHQKLVEIAPAPNLDESVSEALFTAATRMAQAVNLRGVATFEFLVDKGGKNFFFLETNPRLQVEHTCTEMVRGVDIVALQLQLAGGAKLDALDLGGPETGYAVQVRINAERVHQDGLVSAGVGTLTRFDLANGPGVRVDSAAYTGYPVTGNYDSLLAKLIVHSKSDSLDAALARTRRALDECVVEGCDTSLELTRSILSRPELLNSTFHTRMVDDNLSELLPVDTERARQDTPVSADLGAGLIGVTAPLRGTIVSLDIAVGEPVRSGQRVLTLESMKMHHDVCSDMSGIVQSIAVRDGDTVGEGALLATLLADDNIGDASAIESEIDLDATRPDLEEVRERLALGQDEARAAAVAKRHKLGFRTARENVSDLVDKDSFIEYGALSIAAQRRRRSVEDLMVATPADGMIAGIGTVNAEHFGADDSRCAVLAYDYTVLAGTQGHMNHKKKDRLFELAAQWEIPTIFFTEGGGGRPGDVDTDDIVMSWLDLKTFTTWAELSGIAPRIAVNSGRCFAGNAVVFGCADITIATRSSNIGLGGPAMIEGGGLGKYTPDEVGPIDVQTRNGVVDIECEDEAHATAVARQVLGFFQGQIKLWACADQRRLRHHIPQDRLRVYDVRRIISDLADADSMVELRPRYGIGIITAFIRVEGRAFGLIANDPRHLGGAIDSEAGEKAGRFLQLCDAYGLPVVSLCDTPGYMVGPDSEVTASVRRGSRLILATANLTVPLFTVVLRKGYGLGAQAMAGGGFHRPAFIVAWPTAEFGPMGLEGAVELGYRKELEATADDTARKALFDELVAGMYAKGKGVSVAQVFEIDAVIDPAETRDWLTRGLRSCGPIKRGSRPFVDVW